MPHFKCEMSVFMGQLWRKGRIAGRILCISWHTRYPPKAVKYITCRVMSFRPWQASCVPLGGLSRLHSPIALILSPLSTSPSLSFHLLHCCLPHCCVLFLHSVPIFYFTLPLLSSLFVISLLFILIVSPSLDASSAPRLMLSSATSVAWRAAKHCSAMIQKPHINTGISPRDYLSVARLPSRVPCSNLCSPMNRVELGKRGFG